MSDDDSAAPGARSSIDAESDRVAWRLAVEAAGVGAFVWDLVTGDLRWDDRLLELFGLDEESFGGTIGAFNRCVHPDDLGRVIGRGGRTARALRQVITGVGGKGIRVDVIDVDQR